MGFSHDVRAYVQTTTDTSNLSEDPSSRRCGQPLLTLSPRCKCLAREIQIWECEGLSERIQIYGIRLAAQRYRSLIALTEKVSFHSNIRLSVSRALGPNQGRMLYLRRAPQKSRAALPWRWSAREAANRRKNERASMSANGPKTDVRGKVHRLTEIVVSGIWKLLP